MTLSARRAEPLDLAAVEAVTEAAYRPYVAVLGAKPLPMTADHGAYIAAGGAWMVERDNAVAGVLELEPPEADHLMIFNLAVSPAVQGGGVGRWMLAFAEERARALSLPELRLYTGSRMERNIGIYRQAGFRETGRRPNPYRPGWVIVDMTKRL